MTRIISFLITNARWLAAGFLLALASSFGQTYFIAIFSDPIRQEFGLSHGEFGLIYMVATLASAATLVQAGQLADTMAERRFAVIVVGALALVCIAMASVTGWLMLVLVIYGLRLFGQGMVSHAAQTFTARWFHATRGRALAVTTLGYPVGEAIAPLAAIAVIATIGWREAWLSAASALLLGFAPLLFVLLAKPRVPKGDTEDNAPGVGFDGRHWTRGEVIRHPLFWLLLPGILAPGCILTVIFFLPSHITEVKGWTFTAMPANYWVYAATSIAASIVFGFAIDRFSARACLPFYQLPMAAGLLVLWVGTTPSTIPLLMGLIGVTAGGAATLHSALWAEFYGTQNLGAIKALAHAAMVFASAAGPGLAGALIDAGVSFPAQATGFAAYAVAVSALYAAIAWAGVGIVRRAARPTA